MPIKDLYDRAEGYGHTAGSAASKDDGTWTVQPSVPSNPSEARNTRIARTLTGRKIASVAQHADLFDRSSGFGHALGDPDDGDSINFASNAVLSATTGSATALAASSGNVNRDVDISYASSATPDSTARAHLGLHDRSLGYGHVAGSQSDTHD